MLDPDDIKYFRNIPGYSKFSRKISGCDFDEKFPDGRSVTPWFTSMRDRIFDPENPVYNDDCATIKEQYAEYLAQQTELSKKGEVHMTPFQDTIRAFYNIRYLEKFVLPLSFPYVGYMNTAEFFEVNKPYILSPESRNPFCKAIRLQYIRFNTKYRVQRNEFYKERDLDKFDPEYDLVFPSYPDEKMVDWFNRYKNFISQSEGEIEEEIMVHYGLYLEQKGQFQKKKSLKRQQYMG